MCGNVAKSGATPVCCLAARRATYGQCRSLLDGPFRRAKNGPSQMRRPVYHHWSNSCLPFEKRLKIQKSGYLTENFGRILIASGDYSDNFLPIFCGHKNVRLDINKNPGWVPAHQRIEYGITSLVWWCQ